jgi:endogenous inhibitor of DNA gyrase (YacG/DUF329 family)
MLTTGPGASGTARCPICRRPADPTCRPFCSKRCAEVDLGRWFTNHYVVPGPPGELDDDDAPSEEEA